MTYPLPAWLQVTQKTFAFAAKNKLPFFFVSARCASGSQSFFLQDMQVKPLGSPSQQAFQWQQPPSLPWPLLPAPQ